jgi:hypothetical protein
MEDDLMFPAETPPSPMLETEVLARTQRVISFQRKRRQAGRAMLACGLVAVGVLLGTRVPREEKLLPVEVSVQPELVVVAKKEKPVQPREVPVSLSATPTIEELEDAAERTFDKPKAAALWRAAGNRYMYERDDIQSALRCFRLMLIEIEPSELKPQPGDSRLLLSLIEAKRKDD